MTDTFIISLVKFMQIMVFLIPVAIPVEIHLFWRLNKRWKQNGMLSQWRAVVCWVLCAATIIITTTVPIKVGFFWTDYRKSTVDVSPMVGLSVEQVYMLEAVVKQLEGHDSITQVNIEDNPFNPAINKCCDLWWRSKSDKELMVTLYFYLYEGEAENRIIDEKRSRSKFRYSFIENSNNTEAVLLYSELYRGEWLVPSARKFTSYIRFGNAVIIMDETCEFDELHTPVSSEFIEFICEMLDEYYHSNET